ncbi:MAG TPA: SDR family oxidoreductase [Kiloniellaceae bacterium]|nr:SDR family oxidoreductase [Kiloniellaceae bacterium]
MLERIAPKVDFPEAFKDLHDLTGKVVFAAGGYGGIGEAIAWALAMAGADVVIAGRSLEKADALATALSKAELKADVQALDCTNVDDIEAAVAAVAARRGAIDILVNCVGIQREEPLLEVSEDAFDEVYRVNLKAAMFLAQATARRQIAAGRGGRQIHLLSVRSQLGLRQRGYSAYCATKGGLVMLVKQHAMELAPDGITVNGIAPTFVYTEMIRHVMENDDFRETLLQRIPLGRIADPKDIAGPALFFASPASAFVTGQTLYVDGGITASQ